MRAHPGPPQDTCAAPPGLLGSLVPGRIRSWESKPRGSVATLSRLQPAPPDFPSRLPSQVTGSPPSMGCPQLEAQGTGPTLLPAMATAQPSVGVWVPGPSKTPVSCGQPPSDDLSVGAGQVTGELELFLRRPLAEKLLIHCPSTLLSPSSAPRLCRATEIGVRKGGRPEGQGAANWPAERSGARGCFLWS